MQAGLHVSRRALLSGAAASIALPSLPQTARALSRPPIPESAWKELDLNISGGVQRPNDPRFVWLTRPENLRYYNPPGNPGGKPDPDAPLGVVRPHSPEEVAYAIQWAQKYNLPMVPRSGGHSYAGCSTIPGLIINATAMRSVKVQDGLIEVGGGAIFGDLLECLRDTTVNEGAGRYTITHGRCRGVGLSAFLMGGGWAIDSSYLGMGCDRVKRVELVLADGNKVYASDTENPDLFWAVRGCGGGNLAYATKWWLEPAVLEPAVKGNVIVFSGNWRLSGRLAPDVFNSLFSTLHFAPATMGSQMTVSTTHETIASRWPYALTLRVVFHGSRNEFDRLLGNMIVAVDKLASRDCSVNGCTSNDVLDLPYWDAQEFFEERAYPNRYQETSLFVGEKIPNRFVPEIFRTLQAWPKNITAARMTVYRMGGQVNTVKRDATAFVHRNSQWMLTTDIDWGNADDPHVGENLKWQRDTTDALSAMLGQPGSYQNFPDPGLKNHTKAYWDSNYSRLLQIKKKYDRNCVFTPPRNQGISAC